MPSQTRRTSADVATTGVEAGSTEVEGVEGGLDEGRGNGFAQEEMARQQGETVNGSLYMKRGASGVQVMGLQRLLNRVANAGLAVDGSFGRLTAAAVRAFQAAQGLVADAIVGPNTAEKLNGASPGAADASGADRAQGGQDTEAPGTGSTEEQEQAQAEGPGVTGEPALSFNSRGAIVTSLQRILNSKGATIEVDGVFGAQTDYAVRAFQRANGLGVDGVVGPNTAAVLNDAGSKAIEDNGQCGTDGQCDFDPKQFDTWREAVIGAAQSHMGAPYYWGADGPSMFDCSGFVLYVLRQDTGLISWGDDTAAGISNRVPGTSNPKKGDPVFYKGSNGITHIEFYMGSGSQTIGASGGGSRTRGDNPNARVKYGDYTRDGRSKSFGSIEGLIQQKLASQGGPGGRAQS